MRESDRLAQRPFTGWVSRRKSSLIELLRGFTDMGDIHLLRVSVSTVSSCSHSEVSIHMINVKDGIAKPVLCKKNMHLF